MSETEGTSPQPAPSGQPKAGDRRRARALAMQGLYQRHFSKTAISDIEAEFMVDNDMSKVDLLYFRDLLRGVHREQGELNKLIEPFLDRPIKEVDELLKKEAGLSPLRCIKYRQELEKRNFIEQYKSPVNKKIHMLRLK